MNNQQRQKIIEKMLKEKFQPEKLEVIDDSHRHVGHKGAQDGRGHFRIHIISKHFAGKSMVECHRMIYAALGNLMQTDIHALQIDCSSSSL